MPFGQNEVEGRDLRRGYQITARPISDAMVHSPPKYGRKGDRCKQCQALLSRSNPYNICRPCLRAKFDEMAGGAFDKVPVFPAVLRALRARPRKRSS